MKSSTLTQTKCANLMRQTERSLTTTTKKEEANRQDYQKNNRGFDTKDNVRKTMSRAEWLAPYTRRRRWHLGESSLVLWPPGSRNGMVAVRVLMGREVNSSKTPFKFRRSYTKSFPWTLYGTMRREMIRNPSGNVPSDGFATSGQQ